MNTYTLKLLFLLCFGAIIFTSGTVLAFDRKDGSTSMKTSSAPKVTILPREISKTLQITGIPTSQPIPLIIGTHWTCHINEYEFEICDMVLTICTDDQSFCTTIE